MAGVRVLVGDQGSLVALDFPTATNWARNMEHALIVTRSEGGAFEVLGEFASWIGVVHADKLDQSEEA